MVVCAKGGTPHNAYIDWSEALLCHPFANAETILCCFVLYVV
jgi:hypothetical protein